MGIRNKRRSATGDVPPCVWARLIGQPFPASDTWEAFRAASPAWARMGGTSVFEWWERVGDDITAEWTQAHPGTRPAGWWEFSAPRWNHPECPEFCRRELAAPRWILLAGVLVEPDFPGWVSGMHMGLFALPPWRGAMHGEDLTEIEVESEAVYLKRHGLLTAGEARAARNAPALETVLVRADEYGLETSTEDEQ